MKQKNNKTQNKAHKKKPPPSKQQQQKKTKKTTNNIKLPPIYYGNEPHPHKSILPAEIILDDLDQDGSTTVKPTYFLSDGVVKTAPVLFSESLSTDKSVSLPKAKLSFARYVFVPLEIEPQNYSFAMSDF